MPYKSFEEVAALESTAQRYLLLNGEPAERVWAAWALGLAFGRSINPDLITSLEQSPHPGTRRQLLVILAGHHEYSILQTFAQSDPDEYVRATACQYLIQTSQPDNAQLEEMLIQSLTTDQSIVRQAILAGAKNGFPRLSQNVLTPLLNNPDVETRDAALTVLLSQHPFFVNMMIERLLREVDDDLRTRIEKAAISSGNSHALLQAVQEAGSTLQPEILDRLIEANKKFDWADLAALSVIDNPAVRHGILQLLDPATLSPAISWLIESVIRPFSGQDRKEWPDSFWLIRASSHKAEALLIQALNQGQTVRLSNEDKSRLLPIIAQLNAGLEYILDEGYDDDDYEYQEIEAQLERLENLQALIEKH